MYKILFTLVYLCSLSRIIVAQDYQSIITNETITINGTKYYAHTVIKGQTIYGISKAYNIDAKELETINPNLKDGLKIGMVLHIPIRSNENTLVADPEYFIFHTIDEGETLYALSKKYNQEIEMIEKVNPNFSGILPKGNILKIPISANYKQIKYDSTQFLIHHVIKQQTLYAISNIYALKTKDIIKANPHLKTRELTAGEIIFIPKYKTKIDLEKTAFSDEYYFYHIIEKKQTLYSLANIYRIKVDDIKLFNPYLQQRSLLEGDTIKIPKQEKKQIKPIMEESVIPKDSILIDPSNGCVPLLVSDRIVKIGIVFPFYANISDTLDNSLRFPPEDDKNKPKVKNKPIPLRIFSKSEPFIQTYLGMLTAVELLKRQNLNIELFVHDTENDSIKTKNILTDVNLTNLDLIFANVTNSNQKSFINYTYKNKVYLVSPFTVNDEFIKNNIWGIQTYPSSKTQAGHMANFLIGQNTKKLIVISDSTDEDQFYSNLKNIITFKNADIKLIELWIKRNEDTINYFDFDSLGINTLLIHSEDQAFVTDVMSKINRISNKFKFKLIGRPKWTRYDNIETELFHKLNTWLFTPTNIDYKSKEVNEFINAYRLAFKTEPDKYAFQGYDIMLFFCQKIQKYGKRFTPCINQTDVKMISMPFNFEQWDKNCGYENEAMYLIHYEDDLQIKIIDTYPEKTNF